MDFIMNLNGMQLCLFLGGFFVTYVIGLAWAQNSKVHHGKHEIVVNYEEEEDL